jgi:hypothetical protein
MPAASGEVCCVLCAEALLREEAEESRDAAIPAVDRCAPKDGLRGRLHAHGPIARDLDALSRGWETFLLPTKSHVNACSRFCRSAIFFLLSFSPIRYAAQQFAQARNA